jgi:hypothetical protein
VAVICLCNDDDYTFFNEEGFVIDDENTENGSEIINEVSDDD